MDRGWREAWLHRAGPPAPIWPPWGVSLTHKTRDGSQLPPCPYHQGGQEKRRFLPCLQTLALAAPCTLGRCQLPPISLWQQPWGSAAQRPFQRLSQDMQSGDGLQLQRPRTPRWARAYHCRLKPLLRLLKSLPHLPKPRPLRLKPRPCLLKPLPMPALGPSPACSGLAPLTTGGPPTILVNLVCLVHFWEAQSAIFAQGCSPRPNHLSEPRKHSGCCRNCADPRALGISLKLIPHSGSR